MIEARAPRLTLDAGSRLCAEALPLLGKADTHEDPGGRDAAVRI
jgi:hypothetical protein